MASGAGIESSPVDSAPPSPSPAAAAAATPEPPKDRLTEDTYQYLLPDHWILDETKLWTVMHGRRVQAVGDQVIQSGARTVLEIGCGDGYNVGKLAKAGLDVAGVDWS